MTKKTTTSNTKWALRYLGSGSFHVPISVKNWKNPVGVSPSAQAAIFQIKNIATNECKTLTFSGGGVAAGFAGHASANLNSSWVEFETENSYTFDDFQGVARMGNASVGLGIGYSCSFLVFNNIDVMQAWYRGEEIDIGGSQAGTGFDLSYHIGSTQIVSPEEIDLSTESSQDTDQTNESNEIDQNTQQQCINSPFVNDHPYGAIPCSP